MSDLTNINARQMQAMRVICQYRLVRGAGGYRCAGSPTVTLAMAAQLRRLGAAERRFAGGHELLVATMVGRFAVERADARRRA